MACDRDAAHTTAIPPVLAPVPGASTVDHQGITVNHTPGTRKPCFAVSASYPFSFFPLALHPPSAITITSAVLVPVRLSGRSWHTQDPFSASPLPCSFFPLTLRFPPNSQDRVPCRFYDAPVTRTPVSAALPSSAFLPLVSSRPLRSHPSPVPSTCNFLTQSPSVPPRSPKTLGTVGVTNSASGPPSTPEGPSHPYYSVPSWLPFYTPSDPIQVHSFGPSFSSPAWANRVQGDQGLVPVVARCLAVLPQAAGFTEGAVALIQGVHVRGQAAECAGAGRERGARRWRTMPSGTSPWPIRSPTTEPSRSQVRPRNTPQATTRVENAVVWQFMFRAVTLLPTCVAYLASRSITQFLKPCYVPPCVLSYHGFCTIFMPPSIRCPIIRFVPFNVPCYPCPIIRFVPFGIPSDPTPQVAHFRCESGGPCLACHGCGAVPSCPITSFVPCHALILSHVPRWLTSAAESGGPCWRRMAVGQSHHVPETRVSSHFTLHPISCPRWLTSAASRAGPAGGPGSGAVPWWCASAPGSPLDLTASRGQHGPVLVVGPHAGRAHEARPSLRQVRGSGGRGACGLDSDQGWGGGL